MRGLRFYSDPVLITVEVEVDVNKDFGSITNRHLLKRTKSGMHLLFQDVDAEGRQEIMKRIHKSIDHMKEIK